MGDLLLDLTNEEVEVARQALRHHVEHYKRNDFKVLAERTQDLLNKVNDAIIDSRKDRVNF
jgi:predicted lipid-binding transport protein (Tim44 family)